jgi:hypothetical protein
MRATTRRVAASEGLSRSVSHYNFYSSVAGPSWRGDGEFAGCRTEKAGFTARLLLVWNFGHTRLICVAFQDIAPRESTPIFNAFISAPRLHLTLSMPMVPAAIRSGTRNARNVVMPHSEFPCAWGSDWRGVGEIAGTCAVWRFGSGLHKSSGVFQDNAYARTGQNALHSTPPLRRGNCTLQLPLTRYITNGEPRGAQIMENRASRSACSFFQSNS